MRNIFYAFGVAMAFMSANALCQADPVTDKREVAAFIQQFYREPEASMTYGEFNGKFDPKKKCILLKQYVHESLIKPGRLPAQKAFCEVFNRYPGYELQDDMGGLDAPPKHKLVSVSVNGDLAEAAVEMPEYYPTTKKNTTLRVWRPI